MWHEYVTAYSLTNVLDVDHNKTWCCYDQTWIDYKELYVLETATLRAQIYCHDI